MTVLEPLMALLAFFAPLALAGVLVEWVARRQRSSHPKGGAGCRIPLAPSHMDESQGNGIDR
jgi:hypothetical protein